MKIHETLRRNFNPVAGNHHENNAPYEIKPSSKSHPQTGTFSVAYEAFENYKSLVTHKVDNI